MNHRGALVRKVTQDECPWLDGDLHKGTVVYACQGGVIGSNVVVSEEPNKAPFYQVPASAVRWDP